METLSAEPPLLQQSHHTAPRSGNACSHSRTGDDQPNNNNPLKYKKKRRRRRQSRKGKGSDAPTKPNGRSSLDSSGGGGPARPSPRESHRRNKSARTPSTPARPPMPLLRPVGSAVPRAPENSTTFIMDDHENSNLFWNFRTEEEFSTPQWARQTPLNSDEEDASTYGTPARPATGDATPRRKLPMGDGTPGGSGTPVHQSSWYPFNVEDFESAYQTAREDRLMAGSHKELRQAIAKLEARAAVLHDALSASPSHILQRLQSQLLHLQEENRSLRVMVNRRTRQQSTDRSSSSSSSTDSDSDSDSTSCSESDCDTCLQRRAREEEKENTCPEEARSTTTTETQLTESNTTTPDRN
ncbi:unnamed protein product [Meganyctiphanes norvegica]|uniref:Uncharacterized protein n=1 Tax=Meganyctiphanes norvegica TaxID=48144 RepID=A0AAV2STQ7_MEGNR